jgi:multimeric flavodoxin WrbA
VRLRLRGRGAYPPAARPNAGPEDVLAADGYIFATPENFAAIAGLMKDFFDRTFYAALERINGRPYATLICAGSDDHNAARQITRITTGWRLRPIAEPLIVCTHAQIPEAIQASKVIANDNLAAAASSERLLRQVWQWGSSEAATNFQTVSGGPPASG